MRTVFVIAAMPVEIESIAAALSGEKKQRSMERFGTRFVLAAEGPGFQMARRSLDGIGSKPDALVSAGICGALDDSLKVGEVFVASSVNGISCSLPETARTYSSGPLVSQDRVAGTVEEKRRLRESGALAVDMEAAVVAEQSREWNVPFFCIRTISDAASEGFVLDLNAARDEQGRFVVRRILGQALRRPVTGLPELFRLKRNSELAAKKLGEFFADCSF